MSIKYETDEHLLEELIEIRRHLHANPELSNEEFETTAYISERLKSAGIRILPYPIRTGVIAEVGGEKGGPVIAIRADIDALPVQEETKLPFASQIKGKMHACGHDFHTAAILGTALLLKRKEQELPGTVRFIFQPAEEKANGALQVIEKGVLDGVSAIFGLHNKPDLPVGTIGVISGPIMAAADGFIVEIGGKGTHAAVPEAGVDPIVAAAHVITAVQTIVSRNVSALDCAVISITRLNSGTAWNVISEKAVLEGTIRTFNEQVRKQVREGFEKVVHGVASALSANATIRWIDGPPPVINDTRWSEQATDTARALGLNVVQPQPSPAGEDFAHYLSKTDGTFVFVGGAGHQEWHHPSFDVDEGALPVATIFFAKLAVDSIEGLLRGK